MKLDKMSRSETLLVRLNSTSVGTLTRLVDDTVVFAFDPTYEENRESPILSQSFKTADGGLTIGRPITGPSLSPFFSNLLPEGPLRDFLADKLTINSKREFFLLVALGLDLPGAVIVEPIGELSSVTDQEYLLAERQARPILRFSLAGVQLKFSAILNRAETFTIPTDGMGGSWILKLPSESHPHLPEIEHAMLSFAKLVGIDVPEIKLVPTVSVVGLPEQFGNTIADSLAVKRFDRNEDGSRIHIEDFAQVYNVYPKDKYEKAGYGHIAKVLWAEAGEVCFTEFVRRLVFTVAIGNGDMHLKNWSLIYTNPLKPSLSPAYDFVPTIGYISRETLALNLGGTKEFNDVTIDKFKKMAKQAGASERLTANIVNETCERVLHCWNRDRDTIGLPAETLTMLDRHMKTLPLLRPH
ncbi:MAG: HipA domain-containing protein [Cyanobacteria bacterium REEB67]|nr:HipA domain-containing protein [Cyanobacteria bacterium REEB67]